MPIVISRDRPEFLYQQVIALIRQMQSAQTLQPGDRLPSLRSLSNKLSISIATVMQAYSELERLEVIEARPKSGYFLKALQNDLIQPRRASLAKKPILVHKQTLIEQVFEAIHRPDVIPLGIANPVAVHSNDKALARIMRQVLTKAGNKALNYAPMTGYLPLKRQLAMSYLEHGLQVGMQEIIITNGAQEALSIALQCVAKAGDVIAVESPTYFGILELVESLGMMVLEIPLCPDNGVWLEDLEHGLNRHDVKACIFSSSISNPLGSFMSEDRCRELVQLLEIYEIPLIEDDVYGDLYFTEQRGTLAQIFSDKGMVLSCSSFSKTTAPGYRVGWLLAGKYHAQAQRLKRAFSCSSSLLSQRTLSDYVASGEHDRNKNRLRQILQVNKDRMIAQVYKIFPKGTRISDPKGGCVLWIELPAGNDSEVLFHKALRHNISIAPGTIFSPSNKFKRCIRISYGIDWNSEVESAISTLGSLVKH